MIKVNIAGLVNNLIVDHDVILGTIKVLYRVIKKDHSYWVSKVSELRSKYGIKRGSTLTACNTRFIKQCTPLNQ